MSNTEGAAGGRALLARRVADAPDFVERVPEIQERLLAEPERLPRCLVATGIGTSEGHARHFAEVAARWLNQPARFAVTSSLAAGPPAGAESDWLVVFSQGLSANARYAFRDVDVWAGVLLVTGLPRPDDAAYSDLEEGKRAWLEALARRGVVQIDLGCGTEYGALLRVIGARVGYAVGWSILRTLAARKLRSTPTLDIESTALRDAQRKAKQEARRIFPDRLPVHPFFDVSRALLIVGEGGILELAKQLSLKIAEGMLRPAPHCVDVLHYAHGPLQSLASRPTSILYLAGCETDWIDRFRSTLDEHSQDLRVIHAVLPQPFSVLEFEAVFDDLVLRVLGERDLNLVDWPGRDRESALYDEGPVVPRNLPRRSGMTSGHVGRILEDAVWPEIESALSTGRRSALVGLGSIEQHGPHLPLGTDHWIATALAHGLAARLEDAIAMPTLMLGCASEHLDFPGTLSLEPQTLESILMDVMASLVRHGFERAFVWTAHGGNIDALDSMRERLVASVPSIEIAIDADLDGVVAMQANAIRSEGFIIPEAAGPHAGEYETSLVAALRSGSVRRAALAPGPLFSAEEVQRIFYPSLRESAPQGVVGDPSHASADRGLRYLDAWLDLLEDSYRSAFESSAEKKRQ